MVASTKYGAAETSERSPASSRLALALIAAATIVRVRVAIFTVKRRRGELWYANRFTTEPLRAQCEQPQRTVRGPLRGSRERAAAEASPPPPRERIQASAAAAAGR